MDAKNLADPRLADLQLKSYHLAAQVDEIPGAAIDSGNVTIDLDRLGEGAEIKLAKFGSETATISVSGTTATLDFTSAVAESDLIELDYRIDL